MKRIFTRFVYIANLKVAGLMSTVEEDSMASRGNKEHRILVIGKAGNGKSATCNTITGSQHFKIGRSFAATTTTVQQVDVIKYGRHVRVIDTPDVTNCNMTPREMGEEVARWREVAHPYPTAVLLTVRCDVRYTAEEHAIYRQIQRLWGDNTLQHRLVVVFTFGDCQDEPIEEELKTVCPELKSVLRDAEHRYVVFNNKAANKEMQVKQLMDILDNLKTNGGTSPSSPQGYLTRVLLAVAGIAGLCFAATLTASQTGWATGFGLLFVASGLGLIALKIKRKMR